MLGDSHLIQPYFAEAVANGHGLGLGVVTSHKLPEACSVRITLAAGLPARL